MTRHVKIRTKKYRDILTVKLKNLKLNGELKFRDKLYKDCFDWNLLFIREEISKGWFNWQDENMVLVLALVRLGYCPCILVMCYCYTEHRFLHWTKNRWTLLSAAKQMYTRHYCTAQLYCTVHQHTYVERGRGL